MTERPGGPLADRADVSTDFSLIGGPLDRLKELVGLPRRVAGFVSFGIALGLLAWLPLFALNALSATLASGPAIPFLQSFGTHTRLLVAVPLFFLAEAVFEPRVRQALRTIVTSGIVPARELPRLRAALDRATRWLNSWWLDRALRRPPHPAGRQPRYRFGAGSLHLAPIGGWTTDAGGAVVRSRQLSLSSS
jgi:hypothetical protein